MDMDKVLKSYLEHICGAENVQENIALGTKTTFKIGGPARFFVTAASKQCLVRLVGALEFIGQKYFILGAGANVLASDEGYNGVVIRLGFREIVDNQCFIYADAGASLAAVRLFAKDNNLSGLEWSAGIPATVGGAVYMNAGAFGGSISEVVAMVDILYNGEVITVDSRECGFGYRTSAFQKGKRFGGAVIVGAYFFLKTEDKAKIEARELEVAKTRREKQPHEPSAGSVFKRPKEDFSVGRAIEELGLKGFTIGGAAISEKHAGFIVNKGEAMARDVCKLMRLVKRKVFEAYNVRLQPEITMLK